MHNTLTRVQNVFGFFTSVAFAVAGAIAISVVLSSQTPSASLQLRNVQVYVNRTHSSDLYLHSHSVKGRPHYYSTKREEYAHITFSLDADLSTLFNWNTKQVFAYITASYPSDSPASIPESEAVVWDAVIPAKNAPEHHNTYIHPTKSTARPKTKKERLSLNKAYPPGKEPGILKLDKQKPKYQITDPWVGALVWDNRRTFGRWQGLKGGEAAFEFPPLKATEAKKEDLKTATGKEKNRGSPA
ncbi:Signal peptidase complex subunit [Elasticomyces elasticus]|nr:Signal peptidase complex subunit [Elasticomyces elasticus]